MRPDLQEIFIQIRDIPYRIPLTTEEADFSCTGKHKQLKELLGQAGLQVRWRVCTFKWSDMALPSDVVSARHDDDSTHAYLEVYIDDSWKVVDATWDFPVRSILPVSEWDGHSNTEIAVKWLETYSPEESAEIIASEGPEVIQQDLILNGEFYAAFNSWLDRERRL